MHVRSILIGLIAATSLTLLSGCGNISADQNNTYTWAIEKNQTTLSGNLPEGWTQNDEFNTNADAFFFSPLLPEDPFRENINIIGDDLSSAQISSPEYANISLKNFRENGAIIEITNRSEIMIGDIEAVRVTHNTTLEGTPTLYFDQLFIVLDEAGYTITFTATPDTQEAFVDNMNMFIEQLSVSKK